MNTTDAFIWGMISLTVVVDVVLVLIGGMGQSISARLYKISVDYPIVPFSLGVVAGHIFWGNLPHQSPGK